MRINKILKFYKLASELSLGDKVIGNDNINKDVMKYIQNELIKAGYPLPRYGADGFFGKETKDAIKKFKNQNGLANEHLFDQSDLNYLINKNNNQNKSNKIENIINNKNLLFGDSQMGGGIGNVLKGLYPGERYYKSGSNAAYWSTNNLLMSKIKARPSKIIIHLNGNGINGTENLINKIINLSPDSKIIWYGAPPAILKKNSPYESVRNEKSLKELNNRRNNNNKIVESLLQSSGLNYDFINPFEDIFNNPDMAYSCTNCDGIHVPESIASQMYT